MKKKLLLSLLMTALVLTACGGKEEAPLSNDAAKEEAAVQEQVQEESTSKTDALAGLYPEGDELVEIPMGTYVDEDTKDICIVKLPSNYFGGAVANLSAVEQEGFDMFNGDDLVSDALNEGLLEGEHSISSISLVNTNLTKEQTDIYCLICHRDEATYEDLKAAYPNYTEFKTGEHPASYWIDDSEYAMGDMTFCYFINDDASLVIYYGGPLFEELGIEAIAENLYNMIEAI